MQEEQVKSKIQELINDFRANKEKYEKGSEADTETKLIEPLFEALGWSKSDFDKQPRAGREGKRGIADYAFKINDNIVFYLEAKKVGIILEKEADKQVISYAISKRPTIPFAVSTNFKEMNIFCVEQENAYKQTFRSFKNPEEYLTDFSSLMWLSKANFENGATLKKAEEEGRLKKRVAIDKILLEDMMRIRKLLVEDIEKNYSKKYELNEKEEIVQRIIDRLIFIRRCEDVGINPENKVLREITNLPHNEAYPKLKTYFKKYDEVYNSGLFAVGVDNDCDKIKVDGEIIKVLIERLYEDKDSRYYYNFSWIDADVLGQVYEQYLGKILQQTKSGRTKLGEGQAHKKEQGIYYTPTYVVDFIVKNTLGELLKNKKIKPKELNILDPACGSGSFLIKVFDYMYKNLSKTKDAEQHKFDSQGIYSIKTEILKKNLYGVDLDNKAVEITKLNLLLKSAEKNRKLPDEVDLHIKHGNSLIDEDSIAGINSFKWDKKFSSIIQYNEKNKLMPDKGFDILVGNPPWVSIKGKQKSIDLSEMELNWLFEKYPCDQYRPNLFEMFIWRALSLVKDGGYFGFIVPDRLCYNRQFAPLRKYILENFTLKKLWFKPLFEGVISDNIIFIIKKEKAKKNSLVEVAEYPSTEFKKIPQKTYSDLSDSSWFIADIKIIKLFEKIKTNSEMIELGKRFKTKVGFIAKPNKVIKKRISANQISVFKGKNILRYGINGNYYFDFKKENLAGGTQDKIKLSKKNKVFLRKTGSDIMASFDSSGTYPEQSVYFIYTDEDKSESELKFLCALLNSKLMNCFYKNFAITNRDATPQLKKIDLDKFPLIFPKDIQEISKKVDDLLNWNNRLVVLGDKTTSETKEIKDKINIVIKEINKKIYIIYGLTKEEMDLVEKS